jgi:hypothetical protein
MIEGSPLGFQRPIAPSTTSRPGFTPNLDLSLFLVFISAGLHADRRYLIHIWKRIIRSLGLISSSSPYTETPINGSGAQGAQGGLPNVLDHVIPR